RGRRHARRLPDLLALSAPCGQHDGVSAADRLSAVTQDARARVARGDLRGARDLLDPAVESGGMALGPDHPQVLASARLLASLHRELGDLADARRVLEEAPHPG